MRRQLFLLTALATQALHGEELAISNQQNSPLYAGTLLAFFSENVPPGNLSIQPFFSVFHNYGVYKNNGKLQKESSVEKLSIPLYLETGITSHIDITIAGSFSYGKYRHYQATSFGDASCYLGFQITKDQKGTNLPDIRLLLEETFPTGTYKHLDPLKGGVDGGGEGSFATTPVVVIAKTFYGIENHPFNLNVNIGYTVSSKVSLSGSNVYGGDATTKGTLDLGDSFFFNGAAEFSITRYAVLGMDIHYLFQGKSHFWGRTKEPISTKAISQLSLAPCFEYSWNEQMSVTLGSWFTIAGKNSEAFVTAMATFFYEF